MAKLKFKSGVTDGASAIAHELDTQNSLVTGGAKLLSIKNAGTEKFALNKDGSDFSPAPVKTWTVRPDEGGAGITAALALAKAAGGGIVQLLAGTYICSTSINITAGDNITVQGMGDDTILQHDNSSSFTTFAWQNNTTYDCAGNNTTKGDTSVYATTVAEAANFLVGDIICVRGNTRTDDSSNIADLEINEVIANGNPTTGEIQLKTPLKFTMTTIRLKRSRNGRYNCIRSLKFTETGSNAMSAFYCNSAYRFVAENITVEGYHQTGAYGVFGMGAQANQNMPGIYNTFKNCRLTGQNAAAIALFHQNNPTLENCTVRNTGVGGSAYDGAIVIERDCRDIVITGCHVSSVANGMGIRVNGTTRRRMTVKNCTILNCYNGGIVLDNESEVYNCYVEHCGLGVTSAFYGAIVVGGNTTGINKVCRNIVKNCRLAVSASLQPNILISDNVFINLQDYGFYAGQNAIMKNNIIIGAGSVGILSQGSNSSISGNVVDSAPIGIQLASSVTKCSVGGNMVHGSSTYAIDLYNITTTDNLVIGNNIQGQSTRNSGTDNDWVANKL